MLGHVRETAALIATLWLTSVRLLAAGVMQPQSHEESIEWLSSFVDARAAARRSGRLLLVKPLGEREGAGGAW